MRLFLSGFGPPVIAGAGLEIPSDQSDWAECGDELDHWPGESGDGVRIMSGRNELKVLCWWGGESVMCWLL